MTDEAGGAHSAKYRKKNRVEVELVMDDGDTVSGDVFLFEDERVLDLLNGDLPFMPMSLANREIILIRKSAVAVCKPLDRPG